jgi:hypothetical protein
LFEDTHGHDLELEKKFVEFVLELEKGNKVRERFLVG